MTAGSAPKKRGRSIRLILAALAGLLLIIGVVQNSQVIVVRFLFWEIEISQIIVIGLSGFLGLVIGAVLGRLNRTGSVKGSRQ